MANSLDDTCLKESGVIVHRADWGSWLRTSGQKPQGGFFGTNLGLRMIIAMKQGGASEKADCFRQVPVRLCSDRASWVFLGRFGGDWDVSDCWGGECW